MIISFTFKFIHYLFQIKQLKEEKAAMETKLSNLTDETKNKKSEVPCCLSNNNIILLKMWQDLNSHCHVDLNCMPDCAQVI